MADSAERVRRWRERNKERSLEQSRAWKAANKDKLAEYGKKWRAENKPYKAAHERGRLAQKRLATPSWADKGAILKVYKTAAAMTEASGVKYEVDHIVPITSDKVCGLHCEANLTIITKSQNSSKRNFYWEGMW